MAKKLERSSLSEAVFEMRWDGVMGAAPPIPIDPSYPTLFDGFTSYGIGQGLSQVADVFPPYSGMMGSISRRLHHPVDTFPVLQIGHGVFAANQSSKYEWDTFKPFAIDAASAVVRSAPKLDHFEMRINLLELRYVNAFDATVAQTDHFLAFIAQATNLKLEVPPFPFAIGGAISGQFQIRLPLTAFDDSMGAVYQIDLQSAERDGAPFILLTHKVSCTGTDIMKAGTERLFRRGVSAWLDKAYEVTSPAFRQLMNRSVLDRMQ